MTVRLAPLPVPMLDPLVDRLREVVVERDDLDVAFLYLRDDRPAVALVGPPSALTAASDAVAAVVAATGEPYGAPLTVVAMAADLDVLDALLAVAAPIGAGGALEVAMAAAATSRTAGPVSPRAEARAHGALVDATLVVPTAGGGVPARGPHGPALRLDLPTAGDGDAVGVFTSPYAQYHSVGPTPTAAVAGWALVEALGPETEVVVDPGLGWAWRPRPDLLRALAQRHPASRPGVSPPMGRGA